MKVGDSGLFVLDASIALAWVLPQQATPATRHLLDHVEAGRRFVVPPLWAFEVANALLALERRKKLTNDYRQTALCALARLRSIVDDESTGLAFTSTSALAMRYSLSVYDASYLELASRRRLPLATRDDALAAAAKAHGVPST